MIGTDKFLNISFYTFGIDCSVSVQSFSLNKSAKGTARNCFSNLYVMRSKTILWVSQTYVCDNLTDLVGEFLFIKTGNWDTIMNKSSDVIIIKIYITQEKFLKKNKKGVKSI